MAEVRAIKNGNWSDPSVWSTGALPGAADDVYSNNFTITVNQNVTVLSVRNTAGTTAVAGGAFVVSADGLTLTASGAGFLGVGTVGFLVFSGIGTLSLVGNVTQGAGGNPSVNVNAGGTLNVLGNVQAGNATNAHAIIVQTIPGATVNITGNVNGAIGAFAAVGVQCSVAANVFVSGTVTGGANASAQGVLLVNGGTIQVGAPGAPGSVVGNTAFGVSALLTQPGPAVVVYGDVIGNTIVGGMTISGQGAVTVNGNVNGPGIAHASTGQLTINGNVAASAIAAIAVSVSGGANVVVNGSITGNGNTGLSITTTAGGTITVNGDITGGGAANIFGLNASVPCTIAVNGNITGGSAVSSAYGVQLAVAGVTLTVGSQANPKTLTASTANAISAVAGTTVTIWGACRGVVAAGMVTVNGVVESGPGGQIGLSITGATPPSIIGNVTAGLGSALTLAAAVTGACTVVGNVAAGSVANAHGISTGSANNIVNVIGNVRNGTASTGMGVLFAAGASGTITGNCYGDNGGSQAAVTNSGVGTVTVYGDAYGGTAFNTAYALSNTGTGTITLWGSAIPGGVGPSPAPAFNVSNSTGCFAQVIKGNDYPNAGVTVAAAGAIGSSAVGAITCDAMVDGSGGYPGTQAIRSFLRDAGTNYIQMRDSNLGNPITLGEATDYPVAANVRAGVGYNFGAQTGTLNVPPAAAVAIGVPVDNGVGTAALAPSNLLGDDLLARLRQCSTVQTIGDQLAALGA